MDQENYIGWCTHAYSVPADCMTYTISCVLLDIYITLDTFPLPQQEHTWCLPTQCSNCQSFHDTFKHSRVLALHILNNIDTFLDTVNKANQGLTKFLLRRKPWRKRLCTGRTKSKVGSDKQARLVRWFPHSTLLETVGSYHWYLVHCSESSARHIEHSAVICQGLCCTTHIPCHKRMC